MTGSVGQKRVPLSFLESVEIPLPPLAEQKRIVAKIEQLLARVNATRERLAKVPTILKRFRQAVLAAACSGQLTEDWRATNARRDDARQLLALIERERRSSIDKITTDKKSSKKSHDSVVQPQCISRSKEGDLPELPETWIWVRFGSVIGDLKNGLSARPNIDPPGIPILRISSVRPAQVLLQEVRYMPAAESLLNEYALRDRDLLFTRYNGSHSCPN